MRKNGTTLHLRATSFPTSNNLELKAEDYEATNSAVFQVAVTNTLNAACQAKFGTEDNQITAYNDDKVLARFSSELEFTSNDIEDILIQVEDLSKELDDEKNFFEYPNFTYNRGLLRLPEPGQQNTYGCREKFRKQTIFYLPALPLPNYLSAEPAQSVISRGIISKK